MKNPNKRELQQIALNNSSDIDLRDLNPYKKCNEKQNSFFNDWYYSCIRQSFMFQKESFRKT